MKRGAAPLLLQHAYGHLIARFFLVALLACASEDEVTGPANPSLDNPEITISAIDPDTVTVDTMVTVLITGSGFTDSSTVTWLIGATAAPGIATLSTTFKSSTEIEAVILISPDAALGLYSVRIRGKKGKQGIAVEKFRVVAKPTELPRPGHASAANDINDSGVIVGSSYDDATGEGIAVKWTPVDSSWTYSILGVGGAVAVNNDGLVARVNFDRAARSYHSWIHFPSGEQVDFGPVAVSDISNNGTIIGRIYDDALRATEVAWRRLSPTTWGAPETLSIPAGFTTAFLSRINGVGDVIGAVSSPDSSRGVVWKFRNGQWLMPDPLDLQLPSGASAINDVGAMVGYVTPCVVGLPNCYSTPVFWPSAGGARRMLPTLYNTRATVNGVNNANLAVGSAWVHWNSGSLPLAAMVRHAVIWFPGSQWPEDLGAIRPSETGEAMAINNHGWIAGTMQRSFFERFATVWKLPASLTTGAPFASRR